MCDNFCLLVYVLIFQSLYFSHLRLTFSGLHQLSVAEYLENFCHSNIDFLASFYDDDMLPFFHILVFFRR